MSVYVSDNLLEEAKQGRFTYYPVTLDLSDDGLLDIVLIIYPAICIRYADRYYNISEQRRTTDDNKYSFDIIDEKLHIYVLDEAK